MTAAINANENRNVMTCDIPSAFIQTPMPDGHEKVLMKITGVLVDLLVQMSPEVYGPFVVMERGKRVLYVRLLRALYGQLEAALLWYRKLCSDLEGIGFKFNPYDACIANRKVKGSQHTV